MKQMNTLNFVGGCWQKICFVISPNKDILQNILFSKKPEIEFIFFIKKFLGKKLKKNR